MPAASAASSADSTSSSAIASSTVTGTLRPTTAARPSTRRVSSSRPASRREISSLTPSGTSIAASVIAPARSISSMKNGLPSVCSRRRLTSAGVGSPCAATSEAISASSRPSSAIRSKPGSRRSAAKMSANACRLRRLELARGADEQHRLARRALEQVAQHQQRRLVAPVHVVEHEHERALRGDADDEPRDGVEELVALGLRRARDLVGRRRARASPGRAGRSARGPGPSRGSARGSSGRPR